MFYALPVETVLEAKARTRRATVVLFLLLIVLYVLFADLLALTAYLMTRVWAHSMAPSDLVSLAIETTLAAVLVAAAHFYYVRAKPLDDLLEQLKTRPADPQDSYHATFLNLVGEAEAATGIHGIRAVVLPTPGLNAFSVQDGKGSCALGVTDGLLSKLSRPELSAVVAHEAAHLAHGDSGLVTTACFLFDVFGKINGVLGRVLYSAPAPAGPFNRRPSSRDQGFSGVLVLLWLVSGVGYLVTRLVSTAISRQREYLADADGVAMCKDPFALAESLYKISRRYRGSVPDSYSALFILNPADSGLDEQEGFFADLISNHPPVSKRISKLLHWAKSDMQSLEQAEDRESQAPSVPSSPGGEPGFMAYREGQWVGPYTPAQFLSMGLLTPASWVCAPGSQQVSRASDMPELLPLFQGQVQGSLSKNACPRCKVALLEDTYEGAEVEQCSFCKGYLLKAGVLERLISREEIAYSPEDIKKARIWRDAQRGPLKDRDAFPDIRCPFCGSPMCKGIHSMLTQVVIDHCSNDACGSIWCDGGELETIQMLILDAHRQPVVA